MSIQPDCKVQISPEVLFQEVAGEIVLLDLRSENYFGLDEVGTRIWRLLETGINSGEIVQILLQEYDVDGGARGVVEAGDDGDDRHRRPPQGVVRRLAVDGEVFPVLAGKNSLAGTTFGLGIVLRR